MKLKTIMIQKKNILMQKKVRASKCFFMVHKMPNVSNNCAQKHTVEGWHCHYGYDDVADGDIQMIERPKARKLLAMPKSRIWPYLRRKFT
jgi:hypothetical protein